MTPKIRSVPGREEEGPVAICVAATGKSPFVLEVELPWAAILSRSLIA